MKDGAACLEGRRLEGDESKSERERENAVGKESKIARNRPVIQKGNTHKTKHKVHGLLVDRVHLGLLWPPPPPLQKKECLLQLLLCQHAICPSCIPRLHLYTIRHAKLPYLHCIELH